jgi:hypothetical protein
MTFLNKTVETKRILFRNFESPKKLIDDISLTQFT